MINDMTRIDDEVHIESHPMWVGSDVDEFLHAMDKLGDPDVRSVNRLSRKELPAGRFSRGVCLAVGASTALASSLALPAIPQPEESSLAWIRNDSSGEVFQPLSFSASTLPTNEFANGVRAMLCGSSIYVLSVERSGSITAKGLLLDAEEDLSFLNSALVPQYEPSIPGGRQAIAALVSAVKKAFPWVTTGSLSFEEYADDDEGWSQLALVVDTGRPLDEERMAREDVFYATVDDDAGLRAALSEVAVSFR